jgi:hypothetical protein
MNVDYLTAFGMMDRLAQAGQQSSVRGAAPASHEMNPADDLRRYKQALEKIARSSFHWQAIELATQALNEDPEN